MKSEENNYIYTVEVSGGGCHASYQWFYLGLFNSLEEAKLAVISHNTGKTRSEFEFAEIDRKTLKVTSRNIDSEAETYAWAEENNLPH